MFSLPIVLLLMISVISTWIISVFRGAYSKNVSVATDKLWFFNLVQNICCLAAITVIFLFSGGFGKFSIYSVAFGIALSIANVFGLYANLKAFSIGPFSYTTVIVSLSAIIPTVSGLFFGEKISAIQWLGIVFMALCIILSPDRSKNGVQLKVNFKWIVLCLVAAGFVGSTGVIQKIHQNSVHKGEMAAFLISGFAAATIVSAVMYTKESIYFKKLNLQPQPINRVALWFFPVISGLACSFPYSLNLFLAGTLPSAVLFPVVNLCPMILSMITGMIIFHERLSKSRWMGLIIGIIATILVSGIIKV